MNPRLLDDLLGGGSVPAGRFSGTSLRELKSAFDSGLLVKVPTRNGGGSVKVAQSEPFRAFVAAMWPGHLGGMTASSPRARNILAARNSKKGATLTEGEMVLARARAPIRIISPGGVQSDDLAYLTKQWGGFAFRLDGPPESPRGPRLPQGLRVMTIENRENFLNSEILEDEADLFLAAAGKMSRRLVAWLHAQEGAQIIHFGDFDPTGLEEFFRLLGPLQRDSRARSVRLFLPDGLENLFRHFGNRKLLEEMKNANAHIRLPMGLSMEADRVIELMREYGPLEQEALRITISNTSAD